MTNALTDSISQYQSRAIEAARELDALREQVHAAAAGTRDKLWADISPQAERVALVAIIDQVLAEADEETVNNAPIVISQFVNAAIYHPKVRSGNGGILLEVFTDAAKDWEANNRRRALKAVLLAAKGIANGGLYRFPDNALAELPLASLETFSALLAPSAHQNHSTALQAGREAHSAMSETAARFAATVSITPAVLDVGHSVEVSGVVAQ